MYKRQYIEAWKKKKPTIQNSKKNDNIITCYYDTISNTNTFLKNGKNNSNIKSSKCTTLTTLITITRTTMIIDEKKNINNNALKFCFF